ncbi:fibronectin type III domain-containing protein [Rarobacter incanus]|nr:fibronectin type III domain-containing protein [Rarobacter incanus]
MLAGLTASAVIIAGALSPGATRANATDLTLAGNTGQSGLMAAPIDSSATELLDLPTPASPDSGAAARVSAAAPQAPSSLASLATPAGEASNLEASGYQPVVAASTYGQAERIVAKLTPKKAKKKLRTLIIRVYSKKKNAVGASLIRKLAKNTDKALRAQTNGKWGLKATQTPWVRVRGGSCTDFSELATQAKRAAARKSGKYRASKYDRVVIYMPTSARCYWAGLAEIGGKTVWLNGDTHALILTHELGHTFGAGHANYLSCSKNRTITSRGKGCKILEYGDLGDLMGAGASTGMMQGVIARATRWTSAKRIVTVRKRNATVTIVPRAATSGKRAIKVSGKKGTYWIEYRTRAKLDTVLTKDLTGVVVTVKYKTRGTGSVAMDMQPQNDYQAVSLPLGASWTSPDGVRLTLRKMNADSATIQIQRRAPRATKPAVQPAPRVVAGDQSAAITVTKGADGGAPIQRWLVTVRPTAGGNTITRTITATASTSRTGYLDGLRNGTSYDVRVQAYNEKGWSAKSAPTRVTPAPVAPQLTVASPADNAVVAATLPITASAKILPISGASIASLDAYLDVPWSDQSGYYGRTGGVGTRSLSLNGAIPLTNMPDGVYTVRIVATDTYGRTSASSRSIRVSGQSPQPVIDAVAPTESGVTVTARVNQAVHRAASVRLWLVSQADGTAVEIAGGSANPQSGQALVWDIDRDAVAAGTYRIVVLAFDQFAYAPNGGAFPYTTAWGVTRAQATVGL